MIAMIPLFMIVGYLLQREKRTEDKLRESEEKYSTLVKRANDGVVIVQDRGFKFLNDRFAEILGYTTEELEGMDFAKILSPESTELAEERYRKRMSGEQVPDIYEMGLLTKKGETVPVEINVAIIEYNGKPADLVYVRDITERKRVEKRIKHLNAVLRAISNVNQLIVKETNRDRLLKGICESLIESRGYNTWITILDEEGGLVTTVGAGLDEDFLPLLEQLKGDELTLCLRKTLGQSGVAVIEEPLSTCGDCPLAKKYYGSGAMSIRLEHGGKVYGVLSVSVPRDFVTDVEEHSLFKEIAGDIAFALHSRELEEERKRAEAEIKREKEFSENLIETAGTVIVAVDLEGNTTLCNTKAVEVTGYDKEEIIGKNWLNLVYPDETYIQERSI